MEIAAMQGKPMPGRKLAKEVLEEFMMIGRSMAARYQPAAVGSETANQPMMRAR
jgi:hypothetical protein